MEKQINGEHTPHLQAKYLGSPYTHIQETRMRGRHAGGNHRRYMLEVYTGDIHWSSSLEIRRTDKKST